MEHRAIKTVRRLLERYPNKSTWDRIIAVLKDDFDEARLETCFVKWCERGYKPLNLDWLHEWYGNGPDQGENLDTAYADGTEPGYEDVFERQLSARQGQERQAREEAKRDG